MKANTFFFFISASAIVIYSLSPDVLVSNQKKIGRNPSSLETKSSISVSQKLDEKKQISPEQMKTLKTNLFQKEIKNSSVLEAVNCKSESKGDQLEIEIAKMLKDKNNVLKKLDILKKENEELKLSSSKKQINNDSKELTNVETLPYMTQVTSLFSIQMQNQMQMQMQMMNLMSQMQINMMPPLSPYASANTYMNHTPYGQQSLGDNLHFLVTV